MCEYFSTICVKRQAVVKVTELSKHISIDRSRKQLHRSLQCNYAKCRFNIKALVFYSISKHDLIQC